LKEIRIYTCEACKKELDSDDWPFSFRGLLNLCRHCRIKAFDLFIKFSKRR